MQFLHTFSLSLWSLISAVHPTPNWTLTKHYIKSVTRTLHMQGSFKNLQTLSRVNRDLGENLPEFYWNAKHKTWTASNYYRHTVNTNSVNSTLNLNCNLRLSYRCRIKTLPVNLHKSKDYTKFKSTKYKTKS